MTRPISILRWNALEVLGAAVSDARTRHLTSLACQDIVYAAKLGQAQAFIAAHAADAGAPVPAYVAAEVAVTGGTALAAAQAILAAAEAFHAGPGPQIEQARRAGKLAIQSAEDADQIQSAQAAALAALQAI